MGNLFSWGGKGGGDSAPPPVYQAPPAQDNSMMIAEMMMGMMESMASSSAAQVEALSNQMPQVPAMPTIPTVAKPLIIDWTEKQEQLAAKAKADYNVEQAQRKGAAQTVLSSPLGDEDDVFVSGSILADTSGS
jgi:hypothetical protein